MDVDTEVTPHHSDSRGTRSVSLSCQFQHVPVERLVQLAAEGDQVAWCEIIRRYNRLVMNRARNCGLSASDAADVAQTTWLRLFQSLASLRQPERVGTWLAVTARHEALRVKRNSRRLVLSGDEEDHDLEQGAPPADLGILTAERDSELWKALDELPKRCRDLLSTMVADPAPNYREISLAFGMPVGSIGPTRARCLDCLRRITKELVA